MALPVNYAGRFVRALRDWESDRTAPQEQLRFQQYEVIRVVSETPTPGWWLGHLHHQDGVFSLGSVEMIQTVAESVEEERTRFDRLTQKLNDTQDQAGNGLLQNIIDRFTNPQDIVGQYMLAHFGTVINNAQRPPVQRSLANG